MSNINDVSQEFIRRLTDDFIHSMTAQIRQKVVADVTKEIAEFDIKGQIHGRILDTVAEAVSVYHWPNDPNGPNSKRDDAVVEGIVSEFKSRTRQFLDKLTSHVQTTVVDKLEDTLEGMDVAAMVQSHVSSTLNKLMTHYQFPEKSIAGLAVSQDGLYVRAENIIPGIISNFESTGIQDKASTCQVTIMDLATVFENKLVSNDLEIAGHAVFKGNVDIQGTVPEHSAFLKQIVNGTVQAIESQYDSGTFDQYCDRVLDKINTDGISSVSVKVGTDAIVIDGTLAPGVTRSNLQSVGALKELQVIGETLLDETVYVSNKRLGINTIEPERTLDIWDQEVQIVAGKRLKDTGYFGTARPQTLVLGTNNRDQLSLNADGTVTINRLNIGKLSHSGASQQPIDNRPMGHIVWNENPMIGAAIGWVSLGGGRWAKFGTIIE